MEDTIPWDPKSMKSGSSNCYCHDYYECEQTGEYLFVLWKAESNGADTILGAQASGQAGNSQVVEYTNNYKGKKVIWGRPCYYWIIPKLNSVVSIKLDNSVCDSNMFQEWVAKCILNRVSHPNKIRSETETGQTRLEFTDGTDLPGSRYSYRFDVSLHSLNTGSAHLQELASKITHIIRRDTIKLNAGLDERSEWIRFFDRIPQLAVRPNAKTRQIEVRAEAKPTATEIKKIIETFAKEERKPSEWNNVGFATEKGTVWADKYRLHETVNISQKSNSVLAASDIYGQLSKNRNRLLAGIIADIDNTKEEKKVKKGGVG